MERDAIRRLLAEVRSGRVEVDEALERLRLGTQDLGFARVDRSRALRNGSPEAVFAPGKTPDQIVEIARALLEAGQVALVTRVEPEVGDAVASRLPGAEHVRLARMIVAGARRPAADAPIVAVVTAGTSDGPTAEECARTVEALGLRCRRVTDVGVAGLARLLEALPRLESARVIVVAAGMDGALPTVVAGLVDVPVIGLPTPTGYGTGEGGRAALQTMLNGCAPGLTVVNIGNGLGAGFAAARIARQVGEPEKTRQP